MKKYIKEAFNSNILRGIEKGLSTEHREGRAKAAARKNNRLERAKRFHVDGEDVDTNDLFHTWPEDKGKNNEYSHNQTISSIEYDYKSEINNLMPNIKEIFSRSTLNFVDWDKVSDDDFISLEPADVRKYGRDNYYGTHILFWIDDKDRLAAVSTGKFIIWARNNYRWRERDKFSDLMTDKYMKTVFVLNTQNNNTANKRAIERRTNRYGRLENTEEQNRIIAANNIERYKSIIAKNNISKFDDTDRVVKVALKLTTKFFIDTDNITPDNALSVQQRVVKVNKLIENILS